MKTILHAVLFSMLVGCATQQTSQLPPQIGQALKRYEAVTASMSRAEVYRSLGEPQKTAADGVEQWRTSDGRQVAVLSLKFTPDGKIVSRDVYVDDPGPFVVKP